MKNWKPIAAFALVVIAAVAAYGYFKYPASEIPAATTRHFRSLAEVEFCSIDPTDSSDPDRTDYGLGQIKGFYIIDTALVSPKKLLDALSAADRANNSAANKCFWPRHAIRDPNNHDNYLLICFQCLQVRYSFEGESGLALITETPKDLFNAKIDEHRMGRDPGPPE